MKSNRTVRLLTLMISIFLIGTFLPIHAAHAESMLAKGAVNSATLNLRTGAGTKNALLATLKRGDAVEVYEVSGTWLRISVPSTGKSGYVSGKYITLDAGSITAYGLGVTSGKVHLRKGPTAGSDSLAIVDTNTGVTVYSADKTTGWYKVKVHTTAQEGYISPRYVKIVCKTGSSSSGTRAGYVNASRVNLRKGAGTAYASLGMLEKNTALTVEESSGSWCKVTVDTTGKKGYIYARYVTIGAAPVTPSSDGKPGYINASGVYLRKGPSTSYASIGTLARNTALTVTGTSGNWKQVTVTSTGQSGYVYGVYVTISSTVTPTPAPTSGTQSTGRINANGVNFRSGPSTSYASIGVLKKDTELTVLGRSGNWYQVRVNATGVSGYVFATYVTVTGSAATPTPFTPRPGYINAGTVHFRTGPGTSYASIGTLSRGTTLTVTGKSGNWYQVRVDATGKTGYVYASYVMMTAVTPTPTPAPATPTPLPATPTPQPATPTPTPQPATPTPTPQPATPTPSPAAETSAPQP